VVRAGYAAELILRGKVNRRSQSCWDWGEWGRRRAG